MKIRSLFLDLTHETTVPNSEDRLLSNLCNLLPGSYKDPFGNLHLEIPGDDTLFVCHVDNYCDSVQKVCHIFDGDHVKTDGRTILGADDKAGATILLTMISQQVPGHYVFFKAEEIGCLGSLDYKKNFYAQLIDYSKCVAFDRRGCSDLVYCQNNINCASLEFAYQLCHEMRQFGMDYMPSEGNVTDSGSFKYLIPECVNLSVGYYNNHSFLEKQDLKFLEKLAYAACQMDWRKLKVHRQLPNLREIVKVERETIERKNREEILAIENELGFSLY